MPHAAREQFLADCFDRNQGHGYSLCRVHMNSCDFSLGNYAHAGVPGDHALSSFSIDRDRAALLPFIREAMLVAEAPIKLLASPWSPPGWMKTNGQMNGGGRLREDCRATWAQCYVRFIRSYEDAGVPIWGVSVQNEPLAQQRWDSCLYSAEEERDFVRDYLGPAFQAASLEHVKILAWDHNRDRIAERASVMYSDPVASRYVWGLGFHWYGDECFDNVRLVHDAWPDKHLIFTEGCQEGGPHDGSWAVAERYARNLIADCNRWAEGWIDWNLLLDDKGGPNHVGNFCSAPILADAASGSLRHQGSFWVMGHFSRYVRPGAERVLCASTSDDIDATAFRDPDGSIAVIAFNRRSTALGLSIRNCGDAWPIELGPGEIATLQLPGMKESE